MNEKMKAMIQLLLGKRLYNALLQTVFLIHNPAFRDHARKTGALKNRYAGKRCFIIGNGPSLKDVDFEKLKDEYTFTVNQLPRNENFKKLKTNFHIWADQRFFDIKQDRPEDVELLNIMKSVRTEESSPIVFYKWSAKKMIESTQLDKILDIYYYGDIGMDIECKLKTGKPIDICKPLPIFSTVVHYAICAAVYLGFQEIYLLGCDCTGFISTAHSKMENGQLAEYAYKISDNEKKRMERVSKQTSIRNELLWYVRIFDTYDSILDYCKRCGVKLYNATSSTLLEGIPRVDLDSIV